MIATGVCLQQQMHTAMPVSPSMPTMALNPRMGVEPADEQGEAADAFATNATPHEGQQHFLRLG